MEWAIAIAVAVADSTVDDAATQIWTCRARKKEWKWDESQHRLNKKRVSTQRTAVERERRRRPKKMAGLE
jgi:hypothetical protein